MAIEPSHKKRKAAWARALGIPMRENRNDDWGLTEVEGYPITLIAADDYETRQRMAQRLEEEIDHAFATQATCANCGGTGTVWHRDVESGGRYRYTTVGMRFYDCIVCNPGALE